MAGLQQLLGRSVQQNLGLPDASSRASNMAQRFGQVQSRISEIDAMERQKQLAEEEKRKGERKSDAEMMGTLFGTVMGAMMGGPGGASMGAKLGGAIGGGTKETPEGYKSNEMAGNIQAGIDLFGEDVASLFGQKEAAKVAANKNTTFDFGDEVEASFSNKTGAPPQQTQEPSPWGNIMQGIGQGVAIQPGSQMQALQKAKQLKTAADTKFNRDFKKEIFIKDYDQKLKIDFEKAKKELEDNDSGIDKDTFGQENTLRNQFLSLTKDYRSIRDSFSRVESSAVDPSAAGDLALIFNYMKILDPGSVVRESEFATAANAAGVPEKIRRMYNKVIEGKKLGPDQRKDFVDRASRLFKTRNTQFTKTVGEYTKLAERYGLSPERILPDLFRAGSQEIKVVNGVAYKKGADGKWHKQ